MITSNARYAPDGPAKRPSCVRSPRGRHPCPRCVRWCSQRRELHPCSTPGLRDADDASPRRPLPQKKKKKTSMTQLSSSSARAPTRKDSGGGGATPPPSTPRRAGRRRRRSADASFSKSFGYKRHSSLKRRGGGRQILYLFFLVVFCLGFRCVCVCVLVVVGGREKCIHEEKSLCIFISTRFSLRRRTRLLTCPSPLDLNSVETLFSSRALPLKRRLCSPRSLFWF